MQNRTVTNQHPQPVERHYPPSMLGGPGHQTETQGLFTSIRTLTEALYNLQGEVDTRTALIRPEVTTDLGEGIPEPPSWLPEAPMFIDIEARLSECRAVVASISRMVNRINL